MNNRKIGAAKEELAVSFLLSNDVKILEQNFRCKLGEIDVIGVFDGYLVFFEVKYRTTDRFGEASFAVDLKKQRKISKVCDYYRFIKKQLFNMPVRFDVIAIDGDEIKWIPNAFEYLGNGF